MISFRRGGDIHVRIGPTNDGSLIPSLRGCGDSTGCGQRTIVSREQAVPPPGLTTTALIPAYNEEEGIAGTLDTLLFQTARIEKIIVIDDCSTDRTAEIAGSYPVTVLRTPQNVGSKAQALNYALPFCSTDLVMVVDADSYLAPDYLERLLHEFSDPAVAVAAGAVLSKNAATPTERGRSIEWLFANSFYRPIQNKAGAPLVIPGCATAYRASDLAKYGGWTSKTVCEDIDYTWVVLLNGGKARYVAGARVWTVDPHSGLQLGRQVNRWMSSVFQSVRLHWRQAFRKPMLTTWILVCLLETLLTPAILILPIIMLTILHMPWEPILGWSAVAQVFMFPSLIYGTIRFRLNPFTVLFGLVFMNYTRLFTAWYTLKALIVELILVPLKFSKGMTVFEKGH